MKIIEQSHEILTPLNGVEILKHIELCGRVAYKSEDKITDMSAPKFVRMLIQRGHESVLEHYSVSVRFITDRAIANELVRHRMASFTQESTRYVKYSDGITTVIPDTADIADLLDALVEASNAYKTMITAGTAPQIARGILPLCTKTEIIMTANLREWRHVLKLRTDKAAHPYMRMLMIPLLNDFKVQIPEVFDDIIVKGDAECENLTNAAS